MAFQLDQVVPWGRNFDEYAAMFALTDRELQQPILGCGDGPASFNSELTRRGGSVISVDPLYAFSTEAIRQRLDDTFAQVMAETRRNRHEFVWGRIPSVEALGRIRMGAMERFLDDFAQGKAEGRYQAQSLPCLNFEDGHFAIALCSHYLFLYSDHLDLDAHIAAVSEMCRVADEARIFPLLQLGATVSPHLRGVMDYFLDKGHSVQIVMVGYEFQRGGNQMLRVSKPKTKHHHPVITQ